MYDAKVQEAIGLREADIAETDKGHAGVTIQEAVRRTSILITSENVVMEGDGRRGDGRLSTTVLQDSVTSNAEKEELRVAERVQV